MSRNGISLDSRSSGDEDPSHHWNDDRAAAGSTLPPADGGKDAWLFLAGSFVIETLTWGFALAFGVLQEYYSTHEPFAESKNIATVGTTASVCDEHVLNVLLMLIIFFRGSCTLDCHSGSCRCLPFLRHARSHPMWDLSSSAAHSWQARLRRAPPSSLSFKGCFIHLEESVRMRQRYCSWMNGSFVVRD